MTVAKYQGIFKDPAMRQYVRTEAQDALKTKRSTVDAPMNPERFPSLPVTPRFELGVQNTAFDINGELLVRTRAVTEGNSPESWFDLGPVPAALPETKQAAK